MMHNFHAPRNLWTALLAGAVGGFIGSLAMSYFHSLMQKAQPPAEDGKEDSTVKTASIISEALFHHRLTAQEKRIAGPAVHYVFGSAMGSVYGVAVDAAPRLRNGWGVPFGVAVWLGAHVVTVPVLGLSDPVTASSRRQEAVELAAHLLYGVVVETVRKLIEDSR